MNLPLKTVTAAGIAIALSTSAVAQTITHRSGAPEANWVVVDSKPDQCIALFQPGNAAKDLLGLARSASADYAVSITVPDDFLGTSQMGEVTATFRIPERVGNMVRHTETTLTANFQIPTNGSDMPAIAVLTTSEWEDTVAIADRVSFKTADGKSGPTFNLRGDHAKTAIGELAKCWDGEG